MNKSVVSGKDDDLSVDMFSRLRDNNSKAKKRNKVNNLLSTKNSESYSSKDLNMPKAPSVRDYLSKASIKLFFGAILILYLLASLGQVSTFMVLNYAGLHYDKPKPKTKRAVSDTTIEEIAGIIFGCYLILPLAVHLLKNKLSLSISQYFHNLMVSSGLT